MRASNTNSAWWCADAKTALLRSIWQHTGHQSLRLRHDSIFARLPAINWQFRHIGGLHTVVGRSLSPVRRRGTHCRNVYATLLTVLLFLAVFSKHSSFQMQRIRGLGEDVLYKSTSYMTLHYRYLEVSGESIGKVLFIVEWLLAAVKCERVEVVPQATELFHLFQTLTVVLQPDIIYRHQPFTTNPPGSGLNATQSTAADACRPISKHGSVSEHTERSARYTVGAYCIINTIACFATMKHTHARLTALCPGLPRWAGTRR